MAEVRLELPFPPKELSPNARVHWREKAKVVARYREECGWRGKVALHDERWLGVVTRYQIDPPVRAVVTFVVPDRHKRDLDNLLAMLKPAWDGLTDAGVLAGDDSERFSVESAAIRFCADYYALHEAGEPKVIVTLRSL